MDRDDIVKQWPRREDRVAFYADKFWDWRLEVRRLREAGLIKDAPPPSLRAVVHERDQLAKQACAMAAANRGLKDRAQSAEARLADALLQIDQMLRERCDAS